MRRALYKVVSGMLLLAVALLSGVQLTHAQQSGEPAPVLSEVTLDITGMT